MLEPVVALFNLTFFQIKLIATSAILPVILNETFPTRILTSKISPARLIELKVFAAQPIASSKKLI